MNRLNQVVAIGLIIGHSLMAVRVAAEPLAPLEIEYQTTELGPVTLYLDAALADRRDEVAAAIDAYVAREQPEVERLQRASLKAGAISNKLETWTGSNLAASGLSGMALLNRMLAPKVNLSAAGLPLDLYVVRASVFADAPEISRVSVDSATGKPEYTPDLLAAEQIGRLEHVAIVREGALFADDLAESLDILLPGKRIQPATTELTRLMLLSRLRGADAYTRWFTVGMSTALAERVLEDVLNETPPEAEPAATDNTDLIWWLDRARDINLPVASEAELTGRRGATAIAESRRLTESQGPAVASRIMTEAAKNGPVSRDSLLAALDAESRERIQATQSFDVLDQRRSDLAAAFNDAIAAGQLDEAAVAAKRLIELRDEPDATEYGRLALILDRGGHPAHADRALAKLINRLRGPGNEEQQRLANQLLVQYAIKTGRHNNGFAAAEKVLAEKPDDANALLLRLDRQLQAGKLNQARLTASRLFEVSAADTIHRKSATTVLEAIHVGLP